MKVALIFIFSLFIFSDVEMNGQCVATFDFTSTAGISRDNSGSFCGNDGSGACSSSLNIFNAGETCTSFTYGEAGWDGTYFLAQDIDACGSNGDSEQISIDLLVPATNSGLVTFSGLFAASPLTSPGYDAADGALIEYSTDGGTSWTTGLSIVKGAGDNLSANGTPLTSTFQKFSFDIGSALGGSTVTIRVSFNTIAGGAESLAIDEFCLEGAVLPVELVRFAGEKKGENIQLNWLTKSERNNEGFSIERKNKTSWEEIGYVKGSGNTDSERAYIFSDEKPVEGNNQYRLKQMDFDGNFAYSSIILTHFSKVISTLNFYPVPVKSSLSISVESATTGRGFLNIFDFSGKLIFTLSQDFSNGLNQFSLNVADWQRGVYFAKLHLPNGEQQIGKIVKQ